MVETKSDWGDERVGEAVVTRAEKNMIIDEILAGYGHRVGETVVGDDAALERLFSTLQLAESESDEGVRDTLCSYLVA
jgi:hypothetical protein